MASSGQSVSNMGSFFRLQLEWETVSQSTANNTSSVNARLYLVSLNSSSTISSTASKTFSITIDGTTSSTTGNVSLNGNQKKLLHSYTRTVNHNSNGTKSVAISGNAEMQVTLSGTYYGTRSTSLTASLNAINVTPPTPSASTISSTVNWRAGENPSVSINRSSTSVTHTVRLYVVNTLIQEINGVGTSATFDFGNSGRRALLFDLIGRSNSAEARIELDSFYNGSKIGSTNVKQGDVAAGIVSIPTFNRSSMTVGQSIRTTFNAYSTFYNHTVVISVNGTEITRVDAATGDTFADFNSAAYANAIHNAIGSSSSSTITFETFTKHATQIIRNPVTKTMAISPNLAATAPSFDGGFTVSEANSAVSTMMSGLTDVFVSGKSNVTVTIPQASLAVAGTGTSISYYRFSLGNRTATANHPTSGGVSVTLVTPSGNGFQNLTVTAVDSRGNEITQSRLVNLLPYTSPTVTVTANRVGAFETATDVTFVGTHSPVFYSNSNRNYKVTHRYRVKSGTAAYGSYVNLSTATTTFNATLQLDNTRSHIIEYTVADRLTTMVRTFTVPAGKPIMFIDSEKNSVGINQFPVNAESFEVGTTAYTSGIIDDESITAPEFNLTGAYPSSIANPSSGLRLYSSSDTGYVEFDGYATGDLKIKTNRPRFFFDKPLEAPSFYGILYGEQISSTNKEANGYNKLSMYSATSHSSLMLIQHRTSAITIVNGSSFVDVTWPTSFDEAPQWVQVTGRDSNSTAAAFSVQNITSTGCRVYGIRILGTSNSFGTTFTAVAGGRKG